MISADITNPNAFGAEEKRKKVSIGLIQATVSDDIASNMAKTIEKIEEASRKGAQIVCLQGWFGTCNAKHGEVNGLNIASIFKHEGKVVSCPTVNPKAIKS